LIIVVVAMTTGSPLAAEVARYGLLAAINQYPDLPGGRSCNLVACINDANAIKDWLVGEQGFSDREIKRLYNKNATTGKIMGAIDELVRKVRPGDVVVIYFSGHGTRLPDESGDETDSLDEALVTYDMVQDMAAGRHEPGNWLTDDVMGRAISKLRTNRVLVVFDCCHSGTATKSFEGYFGSGTSGAEDPAFRSKWLPFGFEWRERNVEDVGAVDEGNINNRNSRHVYIGACQDEEQAMTSGSSSVLTRHFIEVAREHSGDPFDQFMGVLRPRVSRYVEDLVKKKRAQTPQTPILDGETGWSLADLLEPGPLQGTKKWAMDDRVIHPATEVKRGKIKVAVNADKTVYRLGDSVSVTVTSDHAGYLRLYHVETSGRTKLLLPNKGVESPRLEAGVAVAFPRLGTDEFRFEVSPPFGQEAFKAVISTTPFEIDENPADVSSRGLAELGTKGIRVVSAQKIGEAFCYYQVLPDSRRSNSKEP
jgi:hypothetical protein